LVGLELGKVKDEAVKRNMKRKILSIIYGTEDDEQPQNQAKVQYIIVPEGGAVQPLVPHVEM